MPTSIHLRVTWHTDSLDMVVLPSTGASRYRNCFIDGGTSPEYFGYTLVRKLVIETCTNRHDVLVFPHPPCLCVTVPPCFKGLREHFAIKILYL
jgi:hypothetical protein